MRVIDFIHVPSSEKPVIVHVTFLLLGKEEGESVEKRLDPLGPPPKPTHPGFSSEDNYLGLGVPRVGAV